MGHVPAFTVFGDLSLNRTRLFVDAAQAAGAHVEVVSYLQVLSGDPAWRRALMGRLIRLESPGRDFAVELGLLRRGESDADEPPRIATGLSTLQRDPGLIHDTCLWYRGWRSLLDDIASAADEADARFLNRPEDIALMFDKPACHARLATAGVPVPGALPPPAHFAGLMDALRNAAWTRVFLKPSYGSAANGVVAFAHAGDRILATTAIECVRSGDALRLYATRRLRTYRDLALIEQLINALCRERLHVEAWVPKAGLAGRTFDARVVVIGGRACHLVLRSAQGPITNLHLDAEKVPESILVQQAGSAATELLRTTAEKAAACFPNSFCMGIDIALTPTFSRAVVLEVNAFGDLLEGVEWLGADTYTWEVRTVLERYGSITSQAPTPAP